MTNQVAFEPTNENILKLQQQIIGQVQKELEANPPQPAERQQFLQSKIRDAFIATRIKLPEHALKKFMLEIMDAFKDYGPIQKLLDDPTISEVMVNGPYKVFVEQNGKLAKTGVTFKDDNHVKEIIQRIVKPLGRQIDEHSPTVDARLPDGSRVNAVVPPVAIDGSSITIRKFAETRLSVQDLIKFGSITDKMANFLEACVAARLNVVISGGTGSGKTTLLNVLSSFIPDDERIVTIEDAAELQLQQDHVVRLETKSATRQSDGEVSIRDLVRNSLRMRPDRIVVGEVRGGEALDMLQAMNTGHDGSLTTLHANTPRDAISRLETMTLVAGLDMPLSVIRVQIASAVDLIVQQSRMRDGSRKITFVTELGGMEGNTIVMTDLFKFNQTGFSDGQVQGELEPTGMRPHFMNKLEDAGFKLGNDVFAPRVSSFAERPAGKQRRR
jgi:pilus assembly protein CpaF